MEMPIPVHNAFFTVLQQVGDDGARWLTSTEEFSCASLACCMVCRSLPLVDVEVDGETPPQLWLDSTWIEKHVENPVLTRAPSIGGSALRDVTWNWPLQLLSCVTGILAHVKNLTIYDECNCKVEEKDKVEIPPGVKVLRMYEFNRPIWPISFPEGLEVLDFSGGKFNQRLKNVKWPQSLTDLALGDKFNNDIEGTNLPSSLQYLKLGHRFDQPIANVSWPKSLKELTFGIYFNQPIANVSWPKSLKELTFGIYFNQPVAGISWPPSLTRLTFGFKFNQPIDDGVSWPGVVDLKFTYMFNHSVSDVSWPPHLEALTFGKGFDQPIDPSSLPSSLKHLTLERPGAQLPVLPGVTVSGAAG